MGISTVIGPDHLKSSCSVFASGSHQSLGCSVCLSANIHWIIFGDSLAACIALCSPPFLRLEILDPLLIRWRTEDSTPWLHAVSNGVPYGPPSSSSSAPILINKCIVPRSPRLFAVTNVVSLQQESRDGTTLTSREIREAGKRLNKSFKIDSGVYRGIRVVW